MKPSRKIWQKLYGMSCLAVVCVTPFAAQFIADSMGTGWTPGPERTMVNVPAFISAFFVMAFSMIEGVDQICKSDKK